MNQAAAAAAEAAKSSLRGRMIEIHDVLLFTRG